MGILFILGFILAVAGAIGVWLPESPSSVQVATHNKQPFTYFFQHGWQLSFIGLAIIALAVFFSRKA